jgi:hypothetical protein
MFWLELDPNIVKPGWTPFLITLGLAAVMYLLFHSMRRQFRRVDAHYTVPEAESTTVTGDEPAATEPSGTAAADPAPVEGPPPRR